MSPRAASCAVVLAAGEGTRMRSPLPKVLHPVAGQPMVAHVLRAVSSLRPRPRPVVLVVGRGANAVREAALALPDAAPPGDLRFATQSRRLGTGHALLRAAGQAAGRAAEVLVLYGDTPLLTPRTLRRLRDAHAADRPTITMLTAVVDDPTGYGRVVRADGPDGTVARIVEHAEAAPAERALREINAGVYMVRDAWLWPALRALEPSASGELYLTDVIGRAVAEGRRVAALTVDDATEISGVNTPDDLARVDGVLRARHAVRAGALAP